MKIIAVNGSPRKNGNTAQLLREALEGAKSKSADTEFIDLFDLTFKGCISCYACKRLGGSSYGKCAISDELTPILEKIAQADAVIFGSPIYWGNLTGTMRNLLERLLYQYLVYDGNFSSLAPKKIKTGLICTMGASGEQAQAHLGIINSTAGSIGHIFGSSQVLASMDTYAFDDYSKYETSGIDVDAKTKQRENQFPIDRKKAFNMGVELTII